MHDNEGHSRDEQETVTDWSGQSLWKSAENTCKIDRPKNNKADTSGHLSCMPNPATRIVCRFGTLVDIELTAASKSLDANLRETLEQNLASGPAHFLLYLALETLGTALPMDLVLWRRFACEYLKTIRFAALGKRLWNYLPQNTPPLSDGQWLKQHCAHSMAAGLNSITSDMLRGLWQRLDLTFRSNVKSSEGTVGEFFSRWDACWNDVARVQLNLAETHDAGTLPFALLWTYTSGISESGALEYKPLREVLTTFGTQDKLAVLKGLLEPLYNAGERLSWVKTSISHGAVFGVEPISAEAAYAVLKSEDALRALGITLRMPPTWKGFMPCEPTLWATVGELEPSFLDTNALLDFDIGLSVGTERITPQELQSLLEGADELRMLRGRWVTVERRNLTQLMERLNSIKAAVGPGVSLPQATRLIAGLGLTTDPNARQVRWSPVSAGPGLLKLLEDLRCPQRLSKLKAPATLQGTLRHYQEVGVRWLYFLTQLGLGACLADDMGIGKTIQVLALILALKEEAEHAGVRRAPHLIVAPASLVSNWAAELSKFAPSLKCLFAHPSGPAPSGQLGNLKAQDLSAYDLVLSTYGITLAHEGLREAHWDLVILDEAQAIKNPNTRQARAVKTLHSRARIILTGTPVENRSSDLWSLFDFLNPGLLDSKTEFLAFYRRCASAQDFSVLRALVQPYLLRRLKTDPDIAPELPKKIEQAVYCRLTAAQAALYQKERDTFALELERSIGMHRRGLILKYLMRFRQLCNSVEHWKGTRDWTETNSGKLEKLRALALECKANGRKMLVFSAFAEAVKPLAYHLGMVFGHPGISMDGSINPKTRALLWPRFQSDAEVPFFVMTLKTGGAGLNLTAASVVVHFDRWWNPAVENQGTDRAHRIGQTQQVDVYRFICKGTVEEKMDALIRSKTKLVKDLLDTNNALKLTELSNREILKLISLDLQQAASS